MKPITTKRNRRRTRFPSGTLPARMPAGGRLISPRQISPEQTRPPATGKKQQGCRGQRLSRDVVTALKSPRPVKQKSAPPSRKNGRAGRFFILRSRHSPHSGRRSDRSHGNRRPIIAAEAHLCSLHNRPVTCRHRPGRKSPSRPDR